MFSRRTFAKALRRRLQRPAAGDRLRRRVRRAARRTRVGDNMLILNTRKAGNVVLSATEVGKHGATKIFGGAPGQKFARATIGNGLLPEGSAGTLRRLPYEIDGLRTLSVATVERVTGKPVDRKRLARRGRLDRLLGPARARPLRLVLTCGQAHLQARQLPQPDRGDRRGRAVAAGPPPHLVAGGRDGGPGDPRERDRHAAARRAAARHGRRPPTS